MVIITTGKISTLEKLKMYCIPQNNYLATDGNCSCYDALSASHWQVTVSQEGVGSGTVVLYRVVHVRRVEKEVAFEELSLRHLGFSLSLSFNQRSILILHSSTTYAVGTGIYRVYQELRSILWDLIPDLMLSQKPHTHMGTIRNISRVLSF